MSEDLFVITRPIVTDPSAAYTLRLALGACRRGDEVTVVLLDDAVGDGPDRECVGVLTRLRDAEIVLLGDEAIRQRIDQTSAPIHVQPMDDDVLAALMLRPGMRTLWC